MSGPDVATEKRAARRQRVLKRGKILVANGTIVFDCTIRDLSESGARLLCEDTSVVPNQFCLAIIADGIARDAKVAWRRVDQLGVFFVSGARKWPFPRS